MNKCCEKCELSPEDLKAGKLPKCLAWDCPCHQAMQKTNFMQMGEIVACGHCEPSKYAITEGCVCKCHAQAVEGWEKEFTKKHADKFATPQAASALKSFISQLLAKAREEGRIEEAVRCADHEKVARQQGLRMALGALPEKHSSPYKNFQRADDFEEGWNDFLAQSRANIEALLDEQK